MDNRIKPVLFGSRNRWFPWSSCRFCLIGREKITPMYVINQKDVQNRTLVCLPLRVQWKIFPHNKSSRLKLAMWQFLICWKDTQYYHCQMSTIPYPARPDSIPSGDRRSISRNPQQLPVVGVLPLLLLPIIPCSWLTLLSSFSAVPLTAGQTKHLGCVIRTTFSLTDTFIGIKPPPKMAVNGSLFKPAVLHPSIRMNVTSLTITVKRKAFAFDITTFSTALKYHLSLSTLLILNGFSNIHKKYSCLLSSGLHRRC